MNKSPDKSLLQPIMDCIVGRHAVVIGDLCLDVYYFLDETPGAVSVETGRPTRIVKRWHATPGGAANVAANLKALGFGDVSLFGLVGDDMPGRELIHQLYDLRIDTSGIVTVERDGWSTSVYTKIYKGSDEEPRIDLGSERYGNEGEEDELLRRIDAVLPAADVAIVNQQLEHGVHTPRFRSGLARLLTRADAPPVLVDTRHYHEEYPCAVHKLNDEEVVRLSFVEPEPGETRLRPDRAESHLSTIHARWQQPLFVTRAERGCYVYDGEHLTHVPAVLERSPIDPVGAGDSFVAGIAAALAARATPVDGAWLGTLAAGVTMHKRFQTGTATRCEVLELADEADYRHNPDVAENAWEPCFHGETAIEIVTSPPAPERSFSHIVFDHDGTISVLRQGWHDIMHDVMVSCIIGSAEHRVDPETRASISRRVAAFIDETTGVQTIVQMHGLARMVREFGLEDENRVLSAVDYKRIFNDRLMAVVTDRMRAFEDGRYCVDDLTIKGSVAFAQRLSQMDGLSLYLASGTDTEDVVAEAQALGYAHCFNGGIRGSVGDPESDPKRVVVQEILCEAEAGDRVLVIGDGPVEVREITRRGGYAVGAISDEVRRYGRNLAKRPRLVLAGADLLIGDFTWRDELVELLFPGRSSRA